MKRLIFFCALMGIFLTVNAGPRIDVDIGDQVLMENVDTYYENPEISTLQFTDVGTAMAGVLTIGAENPGELSVLSANEDQEGSKLYTRIPVGPGSDMQSMNNEMDELISKINMDLRKMAKIYNLVYEPLTRDRNDLKKSGAED